MQDKSVNGEPIQSHSMQLQDKNNNQMQDLTTNYLQTRKLHRCRTHKNVQSSFWKIHIKFKNHTEHNCRMKKLKKRTTKPQNAFKLSRMYSTPKAPNSIELVIIQ